jgi:Dual specificity phosphatase, catalytic domain
MTNTPLTTEELEALAHPDRGGRFGEPLWSEILPGLWMGGTDDSDVTRHGINEPAITRDHFDTVVTLYAWAGPVDWYVKEVRLGFFDHSEVDLDEHDLAHAARAAYRDWSRGKRVLVRCQAGWNRSGLITALVLLLDGKTPDEAIKLLRERRSPNALCNQDFVRWLHENGPGFVARISDQPSLRAA